jgi:hypothetical protein
MARNISRRTKCVTVLSIGVLILSAISWDISPLKAIVAPIKGIVEPSQPIKQTKATQDEKENNRQLAQAYAYAGWGWQDAEWLCLLTLWTNESIKC